MDPKERSPPPPWQSEPCSAKPREVQTTPCGGKGFLGEVKPNAVEGALKAYPGLIATRQIERTVTSNTEHSPSEGGMTTGDLWDLNPGQ